MRIIFKEVLLIIILAVWTPCVGISQGKTDSLMQYLEIATKNNPTVLQRLNEYQAALQKVPQVGSLSDPELNIGILLSPMELASGNQVAEIQLMQMFPWFGVLRNNKDEMSLMAKAKYESFRDAKLQIFYNVQRTWYELQKILQSIRVTEKNIDILRALERLSLVRFKTTPTSSGNPTSTGSITPGNSVQNDPSGMNNMSGNAGNQRPISNNQPSAMQSTSMGSQSGGTGLADLYRIQIETGELENYIALLKSQQNTSMARFNTYLNRPVKSPVLLPDSLMTDSLEVLPLALPDSSTLANNPMLSMLQYEQQSLEARRRMVSRMGYPMVGLGINYTVINKSEMSTSSMNGEDMIMPMLKITLPIYRKKYKAMKTEASMLKIATEQNYKATANSLQIEYLEALQFYHDAERRVKLYTNQSLLAKKSFDIMVKSFSVSGSGLTDVLRVRQQTLDYEIKQVEAVADYNTAIAWIKRLLASSQIQ